MKFDVIIGNPPYTNGSQGAVNLYLPFLEKVMKIANDNIVFITPSSPFKGSMDSYGKKMRTLIYQKLIYIQDTTKYFKVGISTCGFILDMKKNNMTYKMMVGKELVDVSCNHLCFFDKILNDIISKMEIRLGEHFWEKKKKSFRKDFLEVGGKQYKSVDTITKETITYGGSNKKNKKHHQKYRLVNSYMRNSKPWLAATYIVEPGITIPDKYCSIETSSKKEAESLYSQLTTKLYQFLHEKTHTSRSLDGSQIKFCPYLDTSIIWTDKELYKHFKLTQEEIDYVENNIK